MITKTQIEKLIKFVLIFENDFKNFFKDREKL